MSYTPAKKHLSHLQCTHACIQRAVTSLTNIDDPENLGRRLDMALKELSNVLRRTHEQEHYMQGFIDAGGTMLPHSNEKKTTT